MIGRGESELLVINKVLTGITMKTKLDKNYASENTQVSDDTVIKVHTF